MPECKVMPVILYHVFFSFLLIAIMVKKMPGSQQIGKTNFTTEIICNKGSDTFILEGIKKKIKMIKNHNTTLVKKDNFEKTVLLLMMGKSSKISFIL
jgi:hypothetical protein